MASPTQITAIDQARWRAGNPSCSVMPVRYGLGKAGQGFPSALARDGVPAKPATQPLEHNFPEDLVMSERVKVLFAGACAAASLVALPALAQAPSPAITAAVADKGRPAADTMRDADRK